MKSFFIGPNPEQNGQRMTGEKMKKRKKKKDKKNMKGIRISKNKKTNGYKRKEEELKKKY